MVKFLTRHGRDGALATYLSARWRPSSPDDDAPLNGMLEASANAPAKLSQICPNQQVTAPKHELAVTRREQAMRESDRSLGRHPALDDKIVDEHRAAERIQG